ncbi:zinc transporter ZIP1 [Austrofundulus limnaeus]|uniref:Zinc transporter ZIP1 n=1 Tax=Austrofundulus limnaeus TaxID=52670 RepID=A0A2I4CXY2_AUSLI|nr:PREDICTED: zinc transporter ZIP1 [Austrofundulus limnaeus]
MQVSGGPPSMALEIKLGALVVLLSVTLLFGFLPVCIIRGAGQCSVQPDVRRRWISLISCCSGGVFLATCMLDLLPDYLQGINEAFSTAGINLQFPLPEFIVVLGFFLVLVLEQIFLDFKDRFSSQPEERRSLLGASSLQEEEGRGQRPRRGSDPSDGHFHGELVSQSTLRSLVLVLSLSLHSVFEGLALGLLEEDQEVLEVLVALLIHKSIMSFSLSLQLSQGVLQRRSALTCLLLFSIMSPLGVAVGVGLTQTQTSPRHRLARCTLEGVATGTFIYITFMEILPHELSSSRDRLLKVVLMLLGFTVVTAVLFIHL